MTIAFILRTIAEVAVVAFLIWGFLHEDKFIVLKTGLPALSWSTTAGLSAVGCSKSKAWSLPPMCVSLRKPTHNSELLRHSLHKAGPPLLLVSQFPALSAAAGRESRRTRPDISFPPPASNLMKTENRLRRVFLRRRFFSFSKNDLYKICRVVNHYSKFSAKAFRLQQI